MESDAALLRRLAGFEDRLAVKIAERGLAVTDQAGKRILRSNWHQARCRADLFMQMAIEAEAGHVEKGMAHSND